MSISMYEASVPIFTQMLNGLAGCIDRAVANDAKRRYDPLTLPAVRLVDDMMPFAQQVQVATNHSAGAPARLTGVELPVLGDDERTLAELKIRIARTLGFLGTINPTQMDGSENTIITLPKRARVRHLELAGLPPVAVNQYPMSLYPMTFRGRDYLLHFALPNFYFHVTTAYAVLRYASVDIGKHDYLGELPRIDR